MVSVVEILYSTFLPFFVALVICRDPQFGVFFFLILPVYHAYRHYVWGNVTEISDKLHLSP